jgi:hypothetical protein
MESLTSIRCRLCNDLQALYNSAQRILVSMKNSQLSEGLISLADVARLIHRTEPHFPQALPSQTLRLPALRLYETLHDVFCGKDVDWPGD